MSENQTRNPNVSPYYEAICPFSIGPLHLLVDTYLHSLILPLPCSQKSIRLIYMILPRLIGLLYGFAFLVITEWYFLITFAKDSPYGGELSFFGTFALATVPVLSGVLCCQKNQKPEHLIVGLTGVALCLTVAGAATITYQQYAKVSCIVIICSCWFYPFFHILYRRGQDGYFVKDLDGLHPWKFRTLFMYLATLPMFLFFTDYLVAGFFLHFGVFYFLIEASLTYKANIFRKFMEVDKKCACGDRDDFLELVTLNEEDKNTIIYRMFSFLNHLT